jgi:DNA-binding CsgD family transcriptional regulator
MRKVFAWFRAHPVLADWALAALVVAFSASQGAAVLALSAGLAGCTPARRRYPASACWTAAGLAAVQLGFGWPPVMADLVVALTLYTLAAQRPRRQSVPALAACLLLAGVAAVTWGGAYGPFGAEVAGVAGLVGTAWVLGDSSQRSRESQCRRVRAEANSAAELLGDAPAGVGYLLKDRVADVSEFVEAMIRVGKGGTVLDPEVVRRLLGPDRQPGPLAALSPREREVLALIAEGRSNAAIAAACTISPGVVEKHIASIFAKLGLAPSDADNRRVLAAVTYLLGARASDPQAGPRSRPPAAG